MNARFAVTHAVRGLARGGQRSLLAAVCVAFGVASLVSLQQLSAVIGASIGVDARATVGGDASLAPARGAFDPATDAAFHRLTDSGAIAASTCLAERPLAIATRQGGGRVAFLHRFVGVDPATYPLVGTVRVHGAGDRTFAEVLAEPDAAIVTPDVATQLDLAPGDPITIGGGPDGPPARLLVRAIADMTPDHMGSTVFTSIDTVRTAAGRMDVATSVSVVWRDGGPPATSLEQDGWSVTTPADVERDRKQVVKIFGFMLKGAGLLGLLLAGIGVSNTMHVLLARRRTEIATLKAVGYSRGHLIALFTVETAILGLAGGLAGSAAGMALAVWLRTLFGRMGPILLESTTSPWIAGAGIAVGVTTAAIFGLHAIVRASAVRPSTLFRDEPTPVPWAETIALALALGLLFAGVASAVLGSAAAGAIVVAGGFAGLGLLVLLLGGALLALVAIPVPLPGIAAVARANLRRAPGRALVALVALFCGVFAIGFAAAIITNAADRVARRALPSDGLNLAAYVRRSAEAPILSELRRFKASGVERTVVAPVTASRDGKLLPQIHVLTGIDAALPDSVRITTGAWTPGTGSALAPDQTRGGADRLDIGQTIVVAGATGEPVPLVVSGLYAVQATSPVAPRASGLLTDASMAERIGGSAAQTVIGAAVGADVLDEAARALDRAVLEALVLSRADFNRSILGALENLFAFVAGVAGLAFVAGGVLIANAAGLSMVERRREIGVLKAIGYSSARVLGCISLEFAALGFVAGVLGIAGVAASFAVLNRFQPDARLALDGVQAVWMVALATAIALASAVAASWQPARIRPLEVLRGE